MQSIGVSYARMRANPLSFIRNVRLRTASAAERAQRRARAASTRAHGVERSSRATPARSRTR
jgi:hypothetical protein